MDLNDALQTIVELAGDARERRSVVKPEHFLPADTVAEYLSDQEMRIRVIRKPRLYTSTTIQGFTEALNYLSAQVGTPRDQGEVTAPGGAGPVFVVVGETGIEAILGEHERRDVLRMPLTLSNAYKLLANPRDLDQDEIIAALREEFNSNVSPSNIIAQLRQIKFSRGSLGDSVTDQNRSSLRSESLMEISGMGKDFPEQVQLTLVCFDELWFGDQPAQSVQASLRINIPKCKFRLVPLAGELATAKAVQLNYVAQFIREKCPGVNVATCTVNGRL